MLSEQLVRNKVIRILLGMIKGETNIIYGCLELDALWHEGYEFIGADFGEHYSKLAHLPLPEQYELWDQEALMLKLKEVETYTPFVLSDARILLTELTTEHV
jgi:hypothetical protein